METSNIVFLRRIEEARQKRRQIQKEEEQKKTVNRDLIDFFAQAGET